MPDALQLNCKKAVNFLEHFRKEGVHNIVAIDPLTEKIIGITRTAGHADIEQFIRKHNGKLNLYFSVNEPTINAPDGKLRKEHIAKINAIYLDADPNKALPLERERERLSKFSVELKTSENPPTYIVDSGGGIQAFWLFDKPLDATPENVMKAEALGRGLAEQYSTDKVQNVDRIMRIPFTVNIPTKKKVGRERKLARILHAASPHGTRYADMSFVTPSQRAALSDKVESGTTVDMDIIKQPLPEPLLHRFKETMDSSERLHDIYFALIEKPSRSEYDFALTQQLKWAGYSAQEIAHILWHFPHGKGHDLTAREIIRCYDRVEPMFPPVDDECSANIEAQATPILTARGAHLPEDVKKTDWDFVPLLSMDWKYSGSPIYKNLLYQNAITVIYGQSNVGKSFIAADIAGHVALARNWGKLKFKAKKPIGVVYICAEAGKSFGKRGHALARRLDVGELPFYVLDAAPNFAKEKEDAQRLVMAIKELEHAKGIIIGLVVVDTLATTFAGGNENSSEDMGLYIRNMKYIQRHADTGVLIVHHSGKDQAAGARGHSSLRAATDTEMEVISEKKGERYHRQVNVRKQREGESDLTIKFGLNVIELGKDDDGDIIDSCHVVLESDQLFESVFVTPEDELTGTPKAAYLTLKKFQEPDFLQWCKGRTATEIRKFIVKCWFLLKNNPEKILSLKELENAKANYKFGNESSNFARDFDKIREHLDKTELTPDQWINAHLFKPCRTEMDKVPKHACHLVSPF